MTDTEDDGDDSAGVVDVYDEGFVHVRADPCGHCLLSRDRLVSGERARELIATTRATDGASFICHRSQVSNEHTAVCRRWFDLFGPEDFTFRLAMLMGVIRWVETEQDGANR